MYEYPIPEMLFHCSLNSSTTAKSGGTVPLTCRALPPSTAVGVAAPQLCRDGDAVSTTATGPPVRFFSAAVRTVTFSGFVSGL